MERQFPYQSTTQKKTSNASGLRFFTQPKGLLYISHTLQAWGDRMWAFSIGLYLVFISTDNNLRLTAINAMSGALSMFFFCSPIGYWIDLMSRLCVIRCSIFIQNAAAVVSCVLLLICMSTTRGSFFFFFVIFCVILSSCIGRLASAANKISLEKDWIVVISGTNRNKLADINAMMRRIDMVCNILAPVLMGQIMYGFGHEFGLIFIAAWNVISGLAEYMILVKVYISVPELAVRQKPPGAEPSNNATEEEPDATFVRSWVPREDEVGGFENSTNHDLSNCVLSLPRPAQAPQKFSCWETTTRVGQRIIAFHSGLGSFCSYEVKYASLGLSAVYLTVLSFSSITLGYLYSQGINESLVSICMAFGSVFGLFGTLLFPMLRIRVGLERSGLIGIGSELLCLSLCVLSIFLPGTPWTPFADKPCSPHNASSITSTSSVPPSDCEDSFQLSAIIFIIGLTLARTGLWLYDLSISQIVQENVLECDRGKFGGVQSSNNSFMDFINLTLVIIFPDPETFGYLVLNSFFFVSLGGILYCYYVKRNSVILRRERVENEKPCSISTPEMEKPIISTEA